MMLSGRNKAILASWTESTYTVIWKTWGTFCLNDLEFVRNVECVWENVEMVKTIFC